ncbi:MAG: DUF4157 domain-containing protein, partial [Caldilineaceae bacterium]|nr:DUF4157 domain-containing protein [Caldilineaceae bacterium]
MTNQFVLDSKLRPVQRGRQQTKSAAVALPSQPVAARLQRALGNQALGQLAIQTKLTLGPAGDMYEQEADQVAKQVVQQMDAPPASDGAGEAAQRQGMPEEEEEPMAAKRISDHVQREGMPEEEEEPIAAKRISESIQRQGMPEEEEPMAAARVQRAANLEGGPVDSDVESAIQWARGGGQALGEGVRGAMESSFGADFGGVNVHTGGEADALNQQLQARAFTTGKDIFFRQGEYNPESRDGKELLAHELTHV